MSPEEITNTITQEYLESEEGQENLRKVTNAIAQMRNLAAQRDMQKALSHVEKQEVGYTDNRAGRRAKAKAQKTRGSQQRRIDRLAAAKWNGGK